MSDIKVGSVVQIRDMSGFAERTVNRFNGRCCKVESLTPGTDGYIAHVRIIGCEDESFNSITVRVSRLVYIHQVPKGTQPNPTAKYVMAAGDVFRMTEVRDVAVAGLLLKLVPGQRFRINPDPQGYSWVLEYLDARQDAPHYTDGGSGWINELLNAGVIEKVVSKLAPPFGPVPVDDWSYNSTTLEGLARCEVAQLCSTISHANTARLMFTHIRKADLGCWVRINPSSRHVDEYLAEHGVYAYPDNLGWVFLDYASKAFKYVKFLTNGNVVCITAFEYPAMRPDLEASFSAGMNRQ